MTYHPKKEGQALRGKVSITSIPGQAGWKKTEPDSSLCDAPLHASSYIQKAMSVAAPLHFIHYSVTDFAYYHIYIS